ncbi:MAG: Serine/threonine-protein kinase PknD [Planctomycetota bacterium]
MGQGEMSLPPLEVLQQLASGCDAIEREVREGRAVDIDALVAEFPEEYRAFVRPELQGVLDELIPPSGQPEERDFKGGTSAESDGRYRWMEELGEGGMGRVSVAWDRQLSRRVALKELNPLKAHDPRYRHRFEQEAEITARLDHPGILPVYGRGEQADQTPYYTMRLVAGGEARTLQAAIDALRALPRGSGQHTTELRQLLRRLIDVSNTVAYAHSRGVCHRDLKPANILIGPFGETLVVDWGLARAFGEGVGGGAGGAMEADNGAESPVMGHNQSDGAGTPGFVAPEAREGGGAINWPRVDVYSLGAILHCVLTGSAPMAEITEGVTQDEENSLTSTGQTLSSQKEPTMQARDTEKRSALRLGPGIPKALAAICGAALRPEPGSRYPGPLAFADDLERFLSGEPVSVLPETRLDAIGRWVAANRELVIASAAFAASMLAALGWIVAQQWRHNVELRDQSMRLAVSLKSEAMLREQEQAARELAEQQTEVARRREDLAVDAMRSYAEAIYANETLKQSASLAEVRQQLLVKPIRFFEQLQQVESPGSRPSSDYLRRLARVSEDLSKLSFEYGDTAQCARWVDRAIERYTQWLTLAKEEQGTGKRKEGKGNEEKAAGSGGVDPVEEAKLALAGCYRLKGMMQMFGGDPLSAEGSFQRASEGYASLANEGPMKERRLEGMALLRAVEAIRSAETGNTTLAAERFKEAIASREELVRIATDRPPGGDGGQWVSAAQRETELRDLLQDQAHVSLLLRIGDEQANFEQFDRHIAMLDQKVRAGDGVEHNRLRLAWALHNLGLHRRNRDDQESAVVALERAAAIREMLVNDYPSVLRYRTDLANSMVELGIALWNVGRREESIAKSEEGIRRHRELMTQMPQSPVVAMEMAWRLYTLGHYYMESFLFAQGEEAFAESLRMVGDLVAGNPANPAMVALHRELTWREAQRLMARGEWDEAKGKLAALWGMLQNGPELAIQSLPPIDRDALLDAWSLAAERCSDKSAVENIGRLREAAMAKEGETKGELREIDAVLANGLDADAIAATDSDRLAVITKRAYRKGEYGRVQRICEELLARWESDGELPPPGVVTRWEVLVRYAESAILDSERYDASGDIDEGTARREIALTAMREVPSALRDEEGNGPSRQEAIEASERTLRNAVFVPVQTGSGLGMLEEDERRGWIELWEAIRKAINGNKK